MRTVLCITFSNAAFIDFRSDKRGGIFTWTAYVLFDFRYCSSFHTVAFTPDRMTGYSSFSLRTCQKKYFMI